MIVNIYTRAFDNFFEEQYPYNYQPLRRTASNNKKSIGKYEVNGKEFKQWILKIAKYKSSDDYEIIEEINTSAGAGGYDVPGAFGTLPDAKIELLGYKKSKNQKLNTENTIMESEFIKIAKKQFQVTESIITEAVDAREMRERLKKSLSLTGVKCKEIKADLMSIVKIKKSLNVDNTVFNPSTRQRISGLQKTITEINRMLTELQS